MFTGLVVFVVNPIAALFWILVLHLLTLLLLTGTRPRRAQVWLTAAAGLLPVRRRWPTSRSRSTSALLDSLRYVVLLEAGGFVGPLATLAGCAVVAAVFTAALQLYWSAPPPVRQGTSTPRSPLLH